MEELFHIWKKLRLPLGLLTFALIVGVSGYHYLYPNQPFSHLLYMSVITLSTVGYTDLFNIQENLPALLFTMFLMLLGLGLVLYAVSSITAYFVEGSLDKIFMLQRMFRRMKKMENHYVICGAGQTGIHVVQEMYTMNESFIVVDNSQEIIDHIKSEFKDIIAFKGDATSDEILEKCNIEKAKGLVVALSNDKDNLFLTLTARIRNPKLKIVSRSIDLNMKEKLMTAGANYVVSPNFIGGMRMASEILRPNVVSFLDIMLRGADKTIRVNEFVVPATADKIGKTLGQLNIYDSCKINILGIKNKDEKGYTYNPGPDLKVTEGQVWLYIGTKKNSTDLDKYFS